MLDIAKEDIQQLRDDDLRDLIGLLCEADYRFAQLRTSGIIWGGSQDAGDGGLDVVVWDDFQPPSSSHIPRSKTGFQVKVPAMSVTQITNEMKPKGELRESIKSLIYEEGAYIIISSKASSTDSAIKIRKAAMRSAISDIIGHEKLFIDFYDSGRIATWVRSHPTIIPWIRQKIGQPLQGWQPYGSWSYAGNNSDDYIVDEGVRFFLVTENDKERDATSTIHYLRDKLTKPHSHIRLVGLSGVGKTRFVQTLFDKNIGDAYLDPSNVIYTDISDSPIPEPITLVKWLVSENARAILIVDNCPPDLHRRLVEASSGRGASVNILTIEYDVRDDLPEETDVLRLEPASDDLISMLIERRYSHINSIDRRTITEFSGGNARVAIALANTVKIGETIGRLRNEALFKRLFYQTAQPDDRLLHCAEGLALVYSFDGIDIESEKSELKVIANILNCTVDVLYRSVAELKQKQLIQSRGKWRAILPHAIANYLATSALKAIPQVRLLNTLMCVGHERLLKSFTHRLGFLHDNAEAKEIVCEWLLPDGWLGAASGDLNSLGLDVMDNIAPVAPSEVLCLMEHWSRNPEYFKAMCKTNQHNHRYVRLLRKIAYDANLFIRCAKLICQFCFVEVPTNNYDSPKYVIKSLFYLHLSGTQATPETRSLIIDYLWNINGEVEKDMALYLLDAACEAHHFVSAHDFSFGTRPRDAGWTPKTTDDVIGWYKIFLHLGVKLVIMSSKGDNRVRKLLAEKFYGLWSIGLYDELEELCDEMLSNGLWPEGWISVRRAIQFQKDDDELDSIIRLERIENKLKPTSLLDLVRAYTLTDNSFNIELIEIEADEDNLGRYDKAYAIAEALGKKVADDNNVLVEILPELITSNNAQIEFFGKGLSSGISDSARLWTSVYLAYKNVPVNELRVQFASGVLSGISTESIREEILEMLVDDSIFGRYFPIIQASVDITENGKKRLNRSLELGIAPINSYQQIVWGWAHEAFSNEELILYLQKIITKDGGDVVALEIFSTRLNSQRCTSCQNILEFGRYILTNIKYTTNLINRSFHRSDYIIAEIAGKCLIGESCKEIGHTLCSILSESINTHAIYESDVNHILRKLAEVQPIAFLDVFLSKGIDENNFYSPFSKYSRDKSILDLIDNKEIIKWCNESPGDRYLTISRSLMPFKLCAETKLLDWNPLVYDLLNHSTNVSGILNTLAGHITPNNWSGSKADIIFERAKVIQNLFTHQNEKVASWAKDKYNVTMLHVEKERKNEVTRNIQHNETFE